MDKLQEQIQSKIDNKTKPLGALGRLEEVALQIGLIQQTDSPRLTNPYILVFAGDHGVAKKGVSAFPQEVTYQMVYNFLSGGAAINVLADENGVSLKVVDAGVNFDFEEVPNLINQKVGHGTKSFLSEKAMTKEELDQALANGTNLVNQLYDEGCNVIGFGEMGIGNTASASMIMSKICGLDVATCVGRGTGLDNAGLDHKIKLLSEANELHKDVQEPLDILQTFGGFEIAQMVGAMVQAAKNRMVLMVDGFIASSAYLIANQLHPLSKEFAVFSHQSEEKGHKKMLEFLDAKALLHLNMRLGEGTGCAMVYPILKSAVAMLNNMASFQEANVSEQE